MNPGHSKPRGTRQWLNLAGDAGDFSPERNTAFDELKINQARLLR